MFAYELPINPPVNSWEEYEKPQLIKNTISMVCEDIKKYGVKSRYSEIFDLLYEHIEDNLDMFVEVSNDE